MYYYAHLNTSNLVDSVHSFDAPTTQEGYIEITEEQYNLPIICYRYFPDEDYFEEWFWSSTTDDIRYPETIDMVTTIIDDIRTELENKADTNHTHNGYASADDLQVLEDVIDTKADANHSHSGYANSNHSHTEYATQVALDSLGEEVDGKANVTHSHTEYASVSHSHSEYADANHDHDASYAPISHSHNNYVTTTDFDTLETTVNGKANASALNTHASNTGIHITDAERESWNAKSNFSGNYNDLTNKPSIPSISGLATETYVNTQIGAIDIPSALSDLTADSTHRVVTDAEKTAWNAKSDFSGSYNDLTNKPSIPSISGLATETYVDEAVSTKANASHLHDDRYYTESEIDSKLATKSDTTHTHSGVYDVSGAAASALSSANSYTDAEIETLSETVATKANATHSHAISGVTGLQSALDNKSAVGHTHGDIYYTETEVNSLLSGKANTSHSHTIENITNLQSTLNSKAASNHTHSDIYTETEVDELLEGKANSSHTHTIANVSGLQSALDSKAATSHGTHVSYSTTAPVMDGSASVGTASTVARSDHKHPTDTSRAAKSDLDALTTTVNGKANSSHTHTIANITNLQSTLDGKAASGHTHSNATTSASGLMSPEDKAKLNGIASGANAYTLPTASSTLGGVKTTSTVTSTSGYTACPIIGGVPYYKDTNTTYSLGSFGVTATAAELNYVDGVTSNIQNQLNSKAASSHNHSGVYANASHSHTASAVGAVATTDVATVSEVETYLGI